MRGVFEDLTGREFTWLTVLSYAGRTPHRDSKWLCRCKCGKEVVVFGIALRAKIYPTKSCGCFNKKQTSERLLAHGQSATRRTKEYTIWISAKDRCYNPNCSNYHRYGGRGITMCDHWRTSFENFFADMGRCPPGKMIDRINNDGNYEPGNCRWVTPKESANNRHSRWENRKYPLTVNDNAV